MSLNSTIHSFQIYMVEPEGTPLPFPLPFPSPEGLGLRLGLRAGDTNLTEDFSPKLLYKT